MNHCTYVIQVAEYRHAERYLILHLSAGYTGADHSHAARRIAPQLLRQLLHTSRTTGNQQPTDISTRALETAEVCARDASKAHTKDHRER